MTKKPERQKPFDPAVTSAMTTGRFAPPGQPEPEPARVRLRLDVPQWLRDATIAAAGAEDTSISQLAGFLLAYGLRLYHDGDPDLRALLAASKSTSRSLKWGRNVDLGALRDALAKLADRVSEDD